MAIQELIPGESRGQAAFRQGATFTDDFGRPYDCVYDTRNMGLVAVPIPQFKAPFYVEPQYLRSKRGHIGRLFIDFESWLADAELLERETNQQLQLRARELFPNNYAQALETPEKFPALIAEVGRLPFPRRFVRALRARNPWATGERPDLDPALWFSAQELDLLSVYTAKAPTQAQREAEDAAEFAVPAALETAADLEQRAPAEDEAEFAAPEAPKAQGRAPDFKALAVSWRKAGKPGSWNDWVKTRGRTPTTSRRRAVAT